MSPPERNGELLACPVAGREPRFKPQKTQMSPGFGRVPSAAAAPAEQARTRIDPIVARDHLAHAHEPVPKQPEPQADREVDEIIVQRQQLALEQGEMDET